MRQWPRIAGANLGARDERGHTPLHYAAWFGTPGNITGLIKAGADLDARAGKGLTPLHVAAMFGLPENISAFIEAGADGSLTDELGRTPYDLLAGHKSDLQGTDAYRQLQDARFR